MTKIKNPHQQKSTSSNLYRRTWTCTLVIQILFLYLFNVNASSAETLESKQINEHNENVDDKTSSCPSYGCTMLPLDIIHEKSLESLETMMKQQPKSKKATLTARGHKGRGSEEINQDRAFVLSPFYAAIDDDDDDNDDGNDGNYESEPKLRGSFLLLGVFDGHGNLGEKVSEYSVTTLPRVFSHKMANILSSSSISPEEQNSAIKEALKQTFIEVDQTIPTNGEGGCTASVIFQIKNQIYFANAGDSVSFLALHDVSSNTTHVHYQTREDKPNIPEEMERVHAMGGQVYIPPPEKSHSTSRVYFTDTHKNGARIGLAMSRSIGDWDAGKVGVIPDPLVDMFVIDEVLEFYSSLSGAGVTAAATATAAGGGESGVSQSCVSIDGEVDDNAECKEMEQNASTTNGDFIVFAVSATDGMMDYLTPKQISEILAMSLVDDANSDHLLDACKKLIIEAAMGWHYENNGRYRDDIAISVSVIDVAK